MTYMYDVSGLENGIEGCKKNIKTFEEAIKKENDTINQYNDMISAIKKKEKFDHEMKNRIDIEYEG